MMAAMLLAMFAAAGLQAADKETTVRAFVYTATGASGEHTEEERAGWMPCANARGSRKKKGITLVTSRADANLLIEVLGREQGEEPGGGVRRQDRSRGWATRSSACTSSPATKSRT